MAAGVSLRTIQAQLGHASFALTADTYISILPQSAFTAARDTAELLAAARHARGHVRQGYPRFRTPTMRASRAVKRSTSITTAAPAADQGPYGLQPFKNGSRSLLRGSGTSGIRSELPNGFRRSA